MKRLKSNTYRSQYGASLIVFFLAIIAAGSVFLLVNSSTDSTHTDNQNTTTESLSRAKTALLSFATSYYLRQTLSGTPHAGFHGHLPCPENSTSVADGRSALNCGGAYTSALGRLPWLSLGIEPITDSSGECLWYALSGDFYHWPKPSMTNDDTPGKFQIFNHNGNLLTGSTPEDRVIAVVIAPGRPLTSQNRPSATANLPCKVSRTNAEANQYLDNYQGINNASVDTATADSIEQFITSTGLTDNTSINDRIVSITTKEIFDSIKQNSSIYTNKIRNLGVELSNCLITYSVDSHNSSPSSPPTSGCQTDCDAARSLCFLSATSGPQRAACNRARNDCRRACPSGGGGAGGGSTTAYQLPWPSPVDLNLADFRLNASYLDMAASDVSIQGSLGRLPWDISNSNSVTGVSIINDNTLLDFCSIPLDSESGRLWQNWKDHWFYVVGKDYQPGNTQTSTNCTLCPDYQSNTNDYAALLIFSAERNSGQLRRSNDTESPNPAFMDSKYSISNYLEGSNASNYIDLDGDKSYANYSITDTPNDMLFCIKSDMSAVTGVCP